MYSISDIRLINIPTHYARNNESLSVFEEGQNIPFSVSRVFVVNAGNGSVRGMHAHKECVQLLVCLSGSIEVVCDDGLDTSKFMLSPLQKSLIIPKGIWSTQIYHEKQSSLMVFCSLPFDESDYIRDYDLYKDYVS